MYLCFRLERTLIFPLVMLVNRSASSGGVRQLICPMLKAGRTNNREFSGVDRKVEQLQRHEHDVHGFSVDLVYPQDITEGSSCQALVCPTNSFLCGSSNTGYWLFRARVNVETRVHAMAGSSLQKELDTLPYLNSESKIKANVGDVIKTRAYGTLAQHLQCLYHVVVPSIAYSQQTPRHIEELRTCYLKVIETACLESGVEKLGIPSLGSGVGNIDPTESANQFIAACQEKNQQEQQARRQLSVEVSFVEKRPFILWQKALAKYRCT